MNFSATREIFVGIPQAASGAVLHLPYLVLRHWKGSSRSNTLALGQYAATRGLFMDGVDIVGEWREGAVKGLRDIKTFAINLLDFGSEQAVLTSMPLPNEKTEGISVVVSGYGWAEENTDAHNPSLPTELVIEYTDIVFSIALLKYYESVYLWRTMRSNLNAPGTLMRRINDQELMDILRRRVNPDHQEMRPWFNFVEFWQIADYWRPLPDPRGQGYRFQLPVQQMHQLYNHMMGYYQTYLT